MRTFFGIILMLTALILGFIWMNKSCNELEDAINDENQKYDTLLSKKVILNNDTLMIIDYSFWNSTLILEDNTEISYSLFEKLECIK